MTSLAAASLVFGQGGTEQALRMSSDAALSMHYLIVIDGKHAGWAHPPVQKPGDALITPYQDKIIIMAGAGMSAGFYDWIQSSFDNGHIMKSGEIHACDVDYNSLSIAEFTNAMITEITLPALDGSSKEPAYMKITLSPETITYKKGDGKKVEGKVAPATKKWLSSNFRMEIGDLPCTRVTAVKIPRFTSRATRTVMKDDAKLNPRLVFQAGRVLVDPVLSVAQNFELTLPMRDWDAWEKWMTSTQLLRSQLKDGSITVMNADGTNGYIMRLHDVSIVAMSVQAENINIEDATTFVVELQYRETVLNFIHR